jgi:HD-like signal output (HDOD) protein
MTLMIDLPFPGVEPWVAYFKDVELPVLRHTAHQLDEMRADADNINARKLATVILHDPLMTIRVFGFIEKHRGKRQHTDITTIERALMMIGIHPFFEQFKDLPVVETQLKGHPKAMLGLLKVFARARHAANWARDWAMLRHDLDIDEITVAALLHDIAEILMWCFAPTLAIRVKERQTADHSLRSVLVQAQEYGVPLYMLKMELAKAWGLPQLLVTLMDPEHAESPRVKNVKLAVDLARHTANGWDDAALPDDFKAIEELIHIGHANLLERIGAPDELIQAAREVEIQAEENPPE